MFLPEARGTQASLWYVLKLQHLEWGPRRKKMAERMNLHWTAPRWKLVLEVVL